MKIKLIVFLLFLIFSCENNGADLPPDKLSVNNKPESKIESKETLPVTTYSTVNGHYLIIGYFDDDDNIKKVERFLDGIILD